MDDKKREVASGASANSVIKTPCCVLAAASPFSLRKFAYLAYCSYCIPYRYLTWLQQIVIDFRTSLSSESRATWIFVCYPGHFDETCAIIQSSRFSFHLGPSRDGTVVCPCVCSRTVNMAHLCCLKQTRQRISGRRVSVYSGFSSLCRVSAAIVSSCYLVILV